MLQRHSWGEYPRRLISAPADLGRSLAEGEEYEGLFGGGMCEQCAGWMVSQRSFLDHIDGRCVNLINIVYDTLAPKKTLRSAGCPTLKGSRWLACQVRWLRRA